MKHRSILRGITAIAFFALGAGAMHGIVLAVGLLFKLAM